MVRASTHDPTDPTDPTERDSPASVGLEPALSPAQLRQRLGGLMLRDEHRLARRLRAHRRGDAADLVRVARAIEASERRVGARRASVPAVSYPAELPITARVADIREAITHHQVVVVAGETGSGKTTQLPKICLELGRGIRGLIGHTQPRRIAARTVADRIAEELGIELGTAVGYQVRFNDQSSDETLVKIMTDGILLAEIANDRMLRRYDTLIIDEAHERSLNIDLLLGYLAQLLPRRPDLKVIVTSATIDTERFARHFSRPGAPPAPVLEVSGRSYPVEVRYRPLEREPDPSPGAKPVVLDQPQAIVEAVRELSAAGPGDILVFCSGEREIRDAAEALERAGSRHPTRGRGHPALRAVVDRRAAPRLRPARRAARRARHERRRDVVDRPRHPLRHRHRQRSHLALQLPHESAATADRAGLAGLGPPARRTLRAARPGHLHPAVCGGGFRVPAGLHRPRDPADQPRLGAAADGVARPRRPR